MRARAMLLASVVLSGILTACPYPRETIRFASDERIVRGQWIGTAQRACSGTNNVLWSPDGNKIITLSSRTVLWDVNTGTRLRVLEGINGVTWSADSKQLGLWKIEYNTNTGVQKSTLAVEDAVTGAKVRSFELPGLANLAGVLPDLNSAILMETSFDTSKIWLANLNDGSVVRSFNVSQPGVQLYPSQARLSADGTTLAVSGFARPKPSGLQVQTSPPPAKEDFIQVLSVSSGQVLWTKTNLYGSWPMMLSPTGAHLTFPNTNGRVSLVTIASGKEQDLGMLIPFQARFSRDGLHHLTLLPPNLFFRNTATGITTQELPLSPPPQGYTSAFDVSNTKAAVGETVSNGIFATCPLRVYNLSDGTLERTLDEGEFDKHTLDLNLQAAYTNELEYAITGTANVDGQAFTVRGTGSGGGVARFVPQALPPQPMSARLELLNAAGAPVWVLGSSIPFSPGDVSVSDKKLVGSLSAANTISGTSFGFSLTRKP